MNSRIHPKYKTKDRVGNWPEYERALVRRGDITLWLSTETIDAWSPAPSGQRGGQRKFSDVAIEAALTLRLVFRLPLRQAEGFLRSVLSLMEIDLDVPDHATLSRRSTHLSVELHRIPAKEPIHLGIDSTGLSVVSEGEWAAVKHGGSGKRGWRKLHLGVDGCGAIVAQVLTQGSADDAVTALGLIEEIEDDIASGTADAAYDTIAIYRAAAARGARVVVPPLKSATVPRGMSRSRARDRTVKRVRRSDGAGGRRKRATMRRPAWRTHSFGTSRSSVTGSGLDARGPGKPRR